MSTFPSREEALFSDALAQSPAERSAFLAKACGEDLALLARLASLVQAHAGPGSVRTASPLQAVATGTAHEEEPGAVVGHYKLLQKLGEGGCGVVWMAEQEEPVRRRVALKIIKLGMDTKAVVARFEAERQALAMMDHPNIAKVHDAGATETGRPFFVMELVRGIPITKYCDENHLTPTARLELFIKVCQAIQHAHQKGIIHRDLKPSNILVTVNDGAPTPKIIDFGIAKATQGKLTDATVFTAFEQFIGTPVYMSPEQAEMSSLDIDTRSDVYSLGVLLYELLTGKPPFDPRKFAQEGVDQIRREIREVEPPRPSARLGTLDADERTTIARLRGTAASNLSIILRGDLDWIVMRCIEKDRTRRYDTANGLAMDIERYLRNEPVIARPPSTAYLIRKLIRRHRVGFAAMLTIFGVVGIGAVVSTWQAIRARRAELEQSRLRTTEAELRQRAQVQEMAARRRAYAADMQLVQQALSLDNLVRGRELLDRHKPSPGEPDLRGWEWRYLWQLCQADAADRFCEVGRQSIRGLAASADGRWLATVGITTRRLSLWNLATRQETPVPGIRAGGRVAFAPAGPLFAASAVGESERFPNAQNRIVVGSTETQTIVREFPAGGPCAGLAFSNDGQQLIVGTETPGDKVTLWRIADGRKVAEFDATQPDSYQHFTAFAVSPDGSLAVHGAEERVLRVINLNDGREVWRREAATHGNDVSAVAFSRDGTLIASGAGLADSSIRLWDAASGRLVHQLEGHRRWVIALLFLSDGKTLASASGDRTIRLWDVESGRLLNTLRGHKLEVWRLAPHPDRAALISGGKDGSVFVWDLQSKRENPNIQFATPIVTWRFAEDSKSMLTIDYEGRVARRRGIRFRDVERVIDLGPIVRGTLISLEQISPDLRYIAIQREPTAVEVEVWDTAGRRRHGTFHTARDVHPAAVFHDRDTIRIFEERTADGLLCRERDISSGRERASWRIPVGANGSVTIVFSPDGGQCLSRRSGAGTAVHDLQNGESRSVNIGTDFLRWPQYSPDGRRLAASLMGRHVARLFHTGEYRPVATLSSMMSVPHSVAFSPDGRRLAVGGGDKEAVSLWDTESHEQLLTLPGSGTLYYRTAFSPDGNHLASRNSYLYEGILHLWSAPSWEEIAAAENAQATRQRQP